MIGFISSGFNPPKSLTQEEIEFMEGSGIIVIDTYTSPNYLREFENRELVFADREKLENFDWILNEKRNVAIVIPGDSFSATTHYSIYRDALVRGIKVRVFHNASIFPTAATRMGLHLYKIGPAVSLPRFRENFRPLSPYEKVSENLRKGLHTIILLDTEPPMELQEAIEELEWMESLVKEKIFEEEKEIGVISSIGCEGEKIIFGRIERVRKWAEGGIPYTLIVPAELHFQEKESLELFRI
jgi:diphthine synthase